VPGDCCPTTLPTLQDRLPLLPSLAPGWNLGEDALRALRKRVRVRLQRDPQPGAAIVESQSVKTTGVVGGEERGYDGAKKVKGRKRHLLVDTRGLVLMAIRSIVRTSPIATASSSCSSPRRSASSRAYRTCGWTPLYTGEDRGAGWVEKTLGWTAEIVKHPPKPAPEEVMMRWVREFNKEGVAIDPNKFMLERSPRPFLPKSPRWSGHFLGSLRTEEDEQRLRAAAGELGSVYLRCHEPPDGEEIDSLMRLFRQFLD
jgi:hypothetical protein